MLFDDIARKKLDEIIHGAAIGETVGLLASRMSEAERAEKLTPEGILQLSRRSDLTSTTAEMLRATIRGLESAEAIGSPSNLDIRIELDRAYRQWAASSPLARHLRNIQMTRAIQCGGLGSLSSIERGAGDAMLHVAPIGLAFTNDPGRAFEIAAESAALTDADFNSCLAAATVALIVAMRCSGLAIAAAVREAIDLVRPIDWHREVSNALKMVANGDTLAGCFSPVCTDLQIGLASNMMPGSALELLAQTPGVSWCAGALAGQIAAISG